MVVRRKFLSIRSFRTKTAVLSITFENFSPSIECFYAIILEQYSHGNQILKIENVCFLASPTTAMNASNQFSD